MNQTNQINVSVFITVIDAAAGCRTRYVDELNKPDERSKRFFVLIDNPLPEGYSISWR